MKRKLILLSLALSLFACTAFSQNIFSPLPKLPHSSVAKLAYGVSSDSTMGAFRPVAVLSAAVSDGASLSGGFGVGYGRYKWDDASQSWITQYSVSALAFLGTNGNSISGTVGLVLGIPGTNGLIGAGPGFDWTTKKAVLLTGVQLQFK